MGVDVARVCLFVGAAVVIGLCAPWLAQRLAATRSPRCRAGSVLLVAGLAGLCGSVLLTAAGDYGDALTGEVAWALAGLTSCAAGLILMTTEGAGR